MQRDAARLLHPGVRPSQVQRRAPAIVLLLLFLVPIVQPVTTAEFATDDFGILDALDELLEDRSVSSSDLLAEGIAESTLASVDAASRDVREGDAIVEAEQFLDGLEVRDSTPFDPDHPRAYEFLLDAENHSGAGLPDNLFQTLFSVENWQITDPLAIGINTYAIYLNFSTKNDGPSYETWTSGTFTGDITLGADLNLFDNYIDIDGDGGDDVIVELTVQGLLERGQGWDITTSGGVGPLPGLIPETLWIRPIFQWRVHQIDAADPLWDDMAFLEVSLLKGFAFDFAVQESESYSIVIDTRFTQPPHEFRVGVGLDRITFEIADTVTDVGQLLLDLLGGGVGADTLSLTSISAPYAITIQNPDAPGGSLQTECSDEDWFDPENQPRVDSHADRCAFGVGVGFVHFDVARNDGTVPDVLELAYIDAGFHPEDTGRRLPSEIDLTLRNDNFGDNTFDTVEIFSDRDADVYVHYFEDRSKMPEGEAAFGNISDARIWIRGLPSGSLPQEEINALFTMIGEAPGSINLPGDVPNRMSLFIGIKNFSGDATTNVNDPTLPINPAAPPNTLIVVAAVDWIPLLEFGSTFQRGGFAPDRSSMTLVVEDLPPVIVVSGSFELGTSGVERLRPDNSDLSAISQVLDNALLGLVEIILDLGTIVNSIPGAVVGTAGSAGGTVEVACYTQVKAAWSTGEARTPAEVGSLGFALSSSDQPWLPQSDHLLLSSDASIDVVQGRSGPVAPLVPVAMSARVSGVSGVTQSFDPTTSQRVLALTGSSTEPLVVGHVSHDGPNMTTAQKQAAMISNRPDELRLVQLPERLIYEASAPIGTITYGGQDGDQRNALRLVGLPEEFELVLGSEVGYVASTPLQSVEIQSSNATVPLTMDGDHVRFSVDGDETSLSVRISDVLRMRRLSPLEEGALGPEGNSRVEMQRTSSEPLRLLFEDTTMYDDPLLGLNGRIVIEPLPADITVAVPGGADSDGLELPDFGDQEGVEGLSFFLDDLVAFGRVTNDFIHALTKDLGGSISGESDLAIGMDLETGEAFNLTADMRKGTTPPEPTWVHGLSMEADERVDVALNLSRLDRLTLSGRSTLETIREDGRLTLDEQEQGALVLESAGVFGARDLVMVLADGRLSEDEKEDHDLENWSAQGIDLTERRSWHIRTWLPSLPAGAIDLDYDFRLKEGIPTYQFYLDFTSWQPEYEDMTILVKGISGQDVDLRLTGFDTENPHDVLLDAVFFQERNLTVPRLTLDMRYDVGVPLDTAHAVFIDHTTQTRSEALILDVPRSTDVFATIGDVLILNVTVPDEYQVDGKSAEALMIQQHRFVDGRWWPATVFMRDLPGQLYLVAEPSEVYDIRAETSFQGLFTMDYTSNGEDMDLFVQAYGKAIDSKGDVTMIAEDLPSRFQLKTTDRFGVEIASSGSGVRQLYLRASDVPSSPGLTIQSMEVVGENLKGATIHMHRVGGLYPIIILDGITTGRVIATANAELTPADREPRLEGVPFMSDLAIDGRGVLLDTQFTGILPTASTVGVNGMASDLSLIGSLTGGAVETRHVLVVEPISSAVASGLAWVV